MTVEDSVKEIKPFLSVPSLCLDLARSIHSCQWVVVELCLGLAIGAYVLSGETVVVQCVPCGSWVCGVYVSVPFSVFTLYAFLPISILCLGIPPI